MRRIGAPRPTILAHETLTRPEEPSYCLNVVMQRLAALLLVVLTVLPGTSPFSTIGTPVFPCDRIVELPPVQAGIHAMPAADDDAIARPRADFRGAAKFCALDAVAAQGPTLDHAGPSRASTPDVAPNVVRPLATVLRV